MQVCVHHMFSMPRLADWGLGSRIYIYLAPGKYIYAVDRWYGRTQVQIISGLFLDSVPLLPCHLLGTRC